MKLLQDDLSVDDNDELSVDDNDELLNITLKYIETIPESVESLDESMIFRPMLTPSSRSITIIKLLMTQILIFLSENILMLPMN
jgi:hypothetical protein